jgi:cell division protein FtsI/penicillin-binding protein 2
VWLAVTALMAGSLAACSPDPPGPDDTAKDLSDALTTGDFTDLTLVGASATDAAAQRTAAYAGLAPWTPQVEVGDVVVPDDDPDSATAVMSYTWDVDAGDVDWTYAATARLSRGEEDGWEVTWSPALLAPDLLAGETLTVSRERAARADVLGAAGQVIVQDRPVVRLGVDKTRVAAADQAAAAEGLASALEIDVAAYVARVAAAGEKAFVEAIVVRADDPSYDVAALGALPGVNAVADTLPLAPSRRFARPILGSVGPATAEIVEESAGVIAAGDLTGLSGLQRQYDAQLRGLPGLAVSALAADLVTKRELFRTEPTPGTPLVTTLEPALQDAAETILESVEPASAIVAMRASTGEVLVAASGPGGEGLSTATVGQYPPGSTMKVATSLALLRSGLTPDSTMSCPATLTVDGRPFSNYPGYPASALGEIPLRTALAQSCNTAFLGARDQVSQEALASAAASLGLGAPAELGFPAFLGSVPSTSEGTDHAASLIGQGRVEASPLAMARVAASVANGALVTPRLVVPAEGAPAPDPSASTPTGEESAAVVDEAPAPEPLTAAEADALRLMMRAFVTEGGGAFLQDVPGGEVLAKSGTAQFGAADALRNHAWMIGIQDDLAVAVFVEDGDFGSTTSGPLLEAFLRAVPR